MNNTHKIKYDTHELRDEEIAKDFLHKLEKMQCTFVENVDDSWILQLLLTPGEARIRILHFLVLKLNPELKQIFDMKFILNDDLAFRIKNIVNILSMLGFCDSEDIDLIKGETCKEDQFLFLGQLIDAAYNLIPSIHQQSNNLTFNPDISYWPSNQKSLDNSNNRSSSTLEANSTLLKDMCGDSTILNSLFATRLPLIPQDVSSQISRSSPSTHPRPSKTCRETIEKVPRICELKKILDITRRELMHEEELLKQLRLDCNIGANQEITMNNFKRDELRVRLVELDQIFTSFRYTFETELSSWCHERIKVSSNEKYAHGNQIKKLNELWSHFDNYMKSLTDIQRGISHIKDHQLVDISKYKSNQGDIISDGLMTIKNITNMISILE